MRLWVVGCLLLGGCLDLSSAKHGSLGDYCLGDGSCDVGLQCDTNNHCTDACALITCVPYGRCDHRGSPPSCACEGGELDAAGNCGPACISQSHASTSCADGDVYWYDSCGQREEISDDCGSRGCASATCGETTLAALGDSATGIWGTRIAVAVDPGGTPYVITFSPTYYLEHVAWELRRWDGTTWDDLSTSADAHQLFTNGLVDPSLAVDSAGQISLGWCDGPTTATCNVSVASFNGKGFVYYGGAILQEAQNEHGLKVVAGPGGLVTALWNQGDAQYGEIRQWDGASWFDRKRGDGWSMRGFGAAVQGQALIVGSLGSGIYPVVFGRLEDGVWGSGPYGGNGPNGVSPSAFSNHQVELGVSSEGLVAALVVRPNDGDPFQVYVRQEHDGAWSNLGPTSTPGPLDAEKAVEKIRVVVGPRGEVIVAFSQAEQLYLRLWRGSAWTVLRPASAQGDAIFDPPYALTDFDLVLGGERVCVAWSAHQVGSEDVSSNLLCGFL